MTTDSTGAQLLLDAADALRHGSLAADIGDNTGAALTVLREAAAAGTLPDGAYLQLRIYEQRLQSAQEALHRLAAALR